VCHFDGFTLSTVAVSQQFSEWNWCGQKRFSFLTPIWFVAEFYSALLKKKAKHLLA
jgi:hypothetical protein